MPRIKVPSKRNSISRMLINLVERAAGKEHYRNGRAFLAQGGMDAFVFRVGLLGIVKRRYYQGNIALVEAVKGKRRV